MMQENKWTPYYLFESSWEVCNKVGGIYTVLSTKANTLQKIFTDRVIFIGPDIWSEQSAQDFLEDETLFTDWKKYALEKENLSLKTGRWDVPGNPIVILVDFKPFFAERDQFFYIMWEKYKVNSMHSYGDYDESCIFAYAVGKVIESFYHYYQLENNPVLALFNEWMLGMGALYINLKVPSITTLFTTHATSIGRSIAGNEKPLYAYLDKYNGDQMAFELNMEAKHSVEKQSAFYVDCFTTVSDITANECTHLLDKTPDIVTPNGFEPNFVPEGKEYDEKRLEARTCLLNVAEKLLGCPIDKDAFLISTSGRYEYRNKGLDIFIEAMNRIRQAESLDREIVAFIMVPAWVRDVRADLKAVIDKDIFTSAPLQTPFLTHWLNRMDQDKILNFIYHLGFSNTQTEKLKIIFVPCYLDGRDGIFNKPYYDLLIGMDATIYPSYYEPWGYTPLESVAFGIPTITTNLAGFGLWAKKEIQDINIMKGVEVIERTDYNYNEVADAITQSILKLISINKKEISTITTNCFELAEKAQWSHFISYYLNAFDIATENTKKRKY